MSRDKLSDHAKKSSLPTAMGSSKEFSQGTTRREACKAGAVIYPTASQPWDADGLQRSSAPVGAASGNSLSRNLPPVVIANLCMEPDVAASGASPPRLSRSVPRLARRGLNDRARFAGFTARRALRLMPMGRWPRRSCFVLLGLKMCVPCPGVQPKMWVKIRARHRLGIGSRAKLKAVSSHRTPRCFAQPFSRQRT